MIQIKSDEEVEKMAEAGRITALGMQAVAEAIRPGVSTWELDRIARRTLTKLKARPAFLNYGGFPGSICASKNSVVVHGIPSRRNILREGDIISIDIGAVYGGYVGDMARTFPVGEVSEEAKRLIRVTEEAFWKGIEFARVGFRLGDLSHAIQEHAEASGFGVVRDYVGHGIGEEMHEDPVVPNYGTPGHGLRFEKGLVIAVEPMINLGTWEVTTDDDDGWTVRTADGKISAHYENTIAVTDGDPRVLTII
ncbi:MAG: type I methionyl aminopeptidase [Eubacteriaceae bacterium]|nr:type I methionyl aminopeptidase [Eubacteriaceae bacterium]